MTPEEKLQLIKRNSKEIITEQELLKLLKTKKKPTIYLGTAITQRPHIGYFVWIQKLSDFLKCGFKVKVLLADLHGALDNTPWDVLDLRYKYYNQVIPLMFKSIGVNIKDLELIKGSSFQLQKKYFQDVLKMSTQVSIHDCKKAGSEVVKQLENPKISGLVYPIMQSIDEEYLKADIQYGGVDQRKILMFARENLPKLNYKPRIEFMTPLIPGLTSKKMSASNPKSKIDLLDTENDVITKVNSAFCESGVIEDNGILAFLKHVIMPIKEDNKIQFIIDRQEKYGGNLKIKTYNQLESLFTKKIIHPLDLKKATAKEINNLLKTFKSKNSELEKLAKKAKMQ